jgi:hypothetical protein
LTALHHTLWCIKPGRSASSELFRAGEVAGSCEILRACDREVRDQCSEWLHEVVHRLSPKSAALLLQFAEELDDDKRLERQSLDLRWVTAVRHSPQLGGYIDQS